MSVETGTVIAGTMRDEDVIPALFEVLEMHAPEKSAEIAGNYLFTLRALRGEEEPREHYDDALSLLRDDLWEAMNEIAPEGCYFGAHEGDGADFGFWEVVE